MLAFKPLDIILAILCFHILTTVKANNFFELSASTWNYAFADSISVINRGELLESLKTDGLDIEEGCRCLNGRCEKLCVKERNGVCRRTANVCVCDPEFFKVNDQTCTFCGCGKGFTCSIYHTNVTCSCPQGYYVFDGKCTESCHSLNPCQNGGSCYKGRCACRPGTSGALCESSEWCARKCAQPLLVECLWDRKSEENYCACNDRTLDYDFEQRVCKPCPCGAGTCLQTNGTLSCYCNRGYQEIHGQCKPCDCGRGGTCEKNKLGEQVICHCKDGDFSRGGKCLPCECGHKDAKCETNIEGRKVCKCPYGYEDILGKCVKMNEDDRRCLCHPTANCVEVNDDFNCTCNEGFKGKVHDVPHVGEECIDIDECQDSKTCSDRETTECVNFAGSYTCRCKTGYQPADDKADPRKTSCNKYKMSWAPTGITIGIIIAFTVISVGGLLYLKKRSHFLLSASGIEMQQAAYKR